MSQTAKQKELLMWFKCLDAGMKDTFHSMSSLIDCQGLPSMLRERSCLVFVGNQQLISDVCWGTELDKGAGVLFEPSLVQDYLTNKPDEFRPI